VAKRYARSASHARRRVAEAIIEPYLCETLNLSIPELDHAPQERLLVALGYHEGKTLARWAADHPP